MVHQSKSFNILLYRNHPSIDAVHKVWPNPHNNGSIAVRTGKRFNVFADPILMTHFYPGSPALHSTFPGPPPLIILLAEMHCIIIEVINFIKFRLIWSTPMDDFSLNDALNLWPQTRTAEKWSFFSPSESLRDWFKRLTCHIANRWFFFSGQAPANRQRAAAATAAKYGPTRNRSSFKCTEREMKDDNCTA